MPNKPKPITVAEAGHRGGTARAKKYTHEQLSEWSKKGGWPKGRPRKPKSSKPKGSGTKQGARKATKKTK